MNLLTNYKFFSLAFLSLILAYFFFSLIGCLISISLLLISLLNIGRDNVYHSKSINLKHGINKNQNSRLGGLIIIFFIILVSISNFDKILLEAEILEKSFTIISLFLIVLLGVYDDFTGGNISFLKKFIFQFVIIIILLFENSDLIFSHTGFEFIDVLLTLPLVSYLITLLVIMCFVNACNIADGANGIISGMALIAGYIIFRETNNYTYFIIYNVIGSFFIINIFLGNIYLGDTGSYFVGFIFSIAGLYYYNQGIFTAGLLGCIFSYPCLEAMCSFFRRLILKKNPLKADNAHFHNLLYYYLSNKISSPHFANSLTGILILVLFPFLGLASYIYVDMEYVYFFWLVFLFQIFFYFFAYFIFLKNK